MSEQAIREQKYPTPKALRSSALKVASVALGSETGQRPALLDALSSRIQWPAAWVEKGERYATAAPLIKHLANHMVAGHGHGAHFRQSGQLLPKSDMQRKLSSPHGLILSDMRRLFIFADHDFKAAHSKHAVLLDTYTEQTIASVHHQPGITGEGLVAGGGDFPGAIADYVTVLNDLINEDPVLREFTAEARRDVAHVLLPQALGRDASQHKDDFQASPTVEERHKRGLVSLAVVGDTPELRGAHTSAHEIHGPDFKGYDTPSLLCPAQWELEGEPETALETFVHAGINHAYTVGSFGTPTTQA